MLTKSIDQKHSNWMLSATATNNPQVIFRRAIGLFRGPCTKPLVRKLKALANTVTISSSHNDVVSYGLLVLDLQRQLTDLAAPAAESELISLYVAGLTKDFDIIRSKINDDLATDTDKYTSLQSVITAVEIWTGSLPGDRHLLKTPNSTTTPTTVTTLLSESVPGKPYPTKPHHNNKNNNNNNPARKTFVDFTKHTCESCGTLGHGQWYGKCPNIVQTKEKAMKARAAANALKNANQTAPPPTSTTELTTLLASTTKQLEILQSEFSYFRNLAHHPQKPPADLLTGSALSSNLGLPHVDPSFFRPADS